MRDITGELARYICAEKSRQRGHILSLAALADTLDSLYLGICNEVCHLICLSASGEPVKVIALNEGTAAEAPFYLRTAAFGALSSQGECFILSHNHPGGTAYPSADDKKITCDLIAFMDKMGLCLLDHVIWADRQYVSLRAFCADIPFQPLPEAYRHK